MRKLKLTKIISAALIAVSVMALNPIKASAWSGSYSVNNMTGSTKTVYAEGYQWDNRNGSWTCGTPDLEQAYYNTWICTNGKWYYVNSGGWMVKDVWVNDYYVDNNGAWIPEATKDVSMTGGISAANTATTNINANTSTVTNSTSNNVSSNRTNETNAEEVIKDLKKNFPCWLLVNEKYYYFNENMELEYNTTINGYIIGADGAWIADNTMSNPNVTQISDSLELLVRQVIQKQAQDAITAQGKLEAKQRMQFIRQQQINELQAKIDKWENGTYANQADISLYIEQGKAKIKELQDLNKKDS